VTAVLFLLRAAILVLLWAFVIAAIVAVRHDVFGTRTPRRPAARRDSSPPPRRRARGTPSRLVVTQGALSGTTLPLAGAPITIGRADDSTLVLTDDYVSTKHARLVPRDEEWVLEDLGSTNGTYLDQQRVQGPLLVGAGQPIRIGQTVLELRS